MSVSIYRRNESGIVTYQGRKSWPNEAAFLDRFGLSGIEPRTEKLAGWPHSFVRWYVRPGARDQVSAVGIGG